MIKVCRECGLPRSQQEALCPDCGVGPRPAAHGDRGNGTFNSFSAPVQQNIVNLSVDAVDAVDDAEYDDAPATHVCEKPLIRSTILSWSLTFMATACGLVASAAVVFLFAATFLAMAKVR